MPRPIEIQICRRAFSTKIPSSLWSTYGTATTPTGAMRHYRRAYRETHPDTQSWSGHVRVLVHGVPVPFFALFPVPGFEQESLLPKLLNMTPSQVEDYAERVLA